MTKSKIDRKKLHSNMLIFLGTVVLITGLYFIFNLEIHEWACENEQNAPGCYVTGLIYEEKGQKKKARYFFKRAKELGYSRESKSEINP